MHAVGLITEYNPFHNGHLHHLRESRKAADAEVAVAVMSGHFLQRGEPALLDKWRRAEMALAAGVDLVVELPFPWACNSAPYFADGAVRALDALGGVTDLCFGSEAGALAPLARCADLLRAEAGRVAAGTGRLLREGVAYPAARARVLAELADEGIDQAQLASPNNILGIEYLRALCAAESPMAPHTVRRIGAGYHDTAAAGGIASATGIRALLAEGSDPYPFLPPPCAPLLRRVLDGGETADLERLHLLLLAAIFRGRAALKGICQVEAGIEKRLVEAADAAPSYTALVDAVKSRHLTRTRVQRLLAYVLNDVSRQEMSDHLGAGPLYLHLLGASERGRRFLAASRRERSLPLIGNYSRIHTLLKRFHGIGSERQQLAERQLALELRATRNYTLLLRREPAEGRNRDFFRDALSL